MALTDNLLSYWSFNEGSGTSAADSVGSNTGTLNGATWATGLIDDASRLDGINDHIAFGNALDAIGASSDDPISFSVWVKVSTWNQRGTVLSRYTANAQREYLILIFDNILYLNFYVGTSAYIGRSAPASGFPTGSWVHIVCTYDGSETNAGCKIYVNNSQVDNANVSAGTYTGMANVATAFQIGRRINELFFSGDVDEVGVWQRELTTAEISELYNSGAGLAYPFGAVARNALFFGAGR